MLNMDSDIKYPLLEYKPPCLLYIEDDKYICLICLEIIEDEFIESECRFCINSNSKFHLNCYDKLLEHGYQKKRCFICKKKFKIINKPNKQISRQNSHNIQNSNTFLYNVKLFFTITFLIMPFLFIIWFLSGFITLWVINEINYLILPKYIFNFNKMVYIYISIRIGIGILWHLIILFFYNIKYICKCNNSTTDNSLTNNTNIPPLSMQSNMI